VTGIGWLLFAGTHSRKPAERRVIIVKWASARIGLALLFIWCGTTWAQEHPGFQRGAQYYISRKETLDELLIRVNVWGYVAKPGQYLVPDNTDLISLLSYAGGPTEDARIDAVRLIRMVEGKRYVMEVDLRKFLEEGGSGEVPVLMPGDTVIVPGNFYRLISRVVHIVSQLAIVANVYYWFFVKK